MIKEDENDRWNPARERRRFGRFATQLPATTRRDDLRTRGGDDRSSFCRLQVQDFSLGGLRAEGPVPLKANERLTLRLPAHGQHPALELTGRVRHCLRQEDRYQIGIEFCQTRPEATSSPWRQVSRLFSIAYDPSADTHSYESRADA